MNVSLGRSHHHAGAGCMHVHQLGNNLSDTDSHLTRHSNVCLIPRWRRYLDICPPHAIFTYGNYLLLLCETIWQHPIVRACRGQFGHMTRLRSKARVISSSCGLKIMRVSRAWIWCILSDSSSRPYEPQLAWRLQLACFFRLAIWVSRRKIRH
ncbi:uncharacterized protein CANTADRAFT_297440 [Suhomyces tanzawaensis NRRL Y-17324]|uniref:Uncharacterized protein n=1 Tax=Suhomyces tanzawaensis NRRL Y-17324 TaxID=984487 RepID=A0A1E4SF35_9ASCO|nr:uncharacterized protein CANTADRAFT_297440 [Suhomyces tanzawaensis NRRL Y-17324]ODV78108.1 hypothetical protein CANTADRAFT_297440 [Suhomyces tanzawaensis NRRL Y-17324]